VGRQQTHTCKHLLYSQTMDPEERVIQSNQDVHVYGIYGM
jgi:hypothetical protein